MPWRILILSLCTAFGANARSLAETVAVAPSKDATLIQWSETSPDPNPPLANALGDLFAGRTNQDGQGPAMTSIRRALVYFDLAGAIPNGMRVTEATLTLRDVQGNNGDATITVHRVLQDWGEGTSFYPGGGGEAATDGDATWVHAIYDEVEPAASAFWNTPGGDFAPIASAQTAVTGDMGGGGLFEWTSPQLLADVRGWMAEPAGNFGWVLLGDESTGQSAKRFNSREVTDPPAVPPMLTLEYEPLTVGDYNEDGRVDALDYTTWRDRLGDMTLLPNETASPGAVTAEDYYVWRDTVGAASGASGALALPEPSAGGALAAGLLALGSLLRTVDLHLGVAL